MPKYRTERYSIWRACERFGILPPDIKNEWDNNNVECQAILIAYDQIRQNEEIPK